MTVLCLLQQFEYFFFDFLWKRQWYYWDLYLYIMQSKWKQQKKKRWNEIDRSLNLTYYRKWSILPNSIRFDSIQISLNAIYRAFAILSCLFRENCSIFSPFSVSTLPKHRILNIFYMQIRTRQNLNEYVNQISISKTKMYTIERFVYVNVCIKYLSNLLIFL